MEEIKIKLQKFIKTSLIELACNSHINHKKDLRDIETNEPRIKRYLEKNNYDMDRAISQLVFNMLKKIDLIKKINKIQHIENKSNKKFLNPPKKQSNSNSNSNSDLESDLEEDESDNIDYKYPEDSEEEIQIEYESEDNNSTEIKETLFGKVIEYIGLYELFFLQDKDKTKFKKNFFQIFNIIY